MFYHLLNARSRELVQNDQWHIPHLFPHTKTILKQSFPNTLYIFVVFIIFIVWGRRRYYFNKDDTPVGVTVAVAKEPVVM